MPIQAGAPGGNVVAQDPLTLFARAYPGRDGASDAVVTGAGTQEPVAKR